MRKALSFLGVLVVVSLLVSALSMTLDIPGYGEMSFDECGEHNFMFEKGWNLVGGMPSTDFLAGGPVEADSVKAIYGLSPLTKEYVRFYPKSEVNAGELPLGYMAGHTAFWVYTEESGVTEVWDCLTEELEGMDVAEGWNMLAITRDMYEKSLNDFKGDCDIEKVYIFEDGRWIDAYDDLIDDDMKFNANLVGRGLLIRFKERCDLGFVEQSVDIAPPALPGE